MTPSPLTMSDEAFEECSADHEWTDSDRERWNGYRAQRPGRRGRRRQLIPACSADGE
ncbi:MAG: hypothetical protein WC455_21665 [Dehalococcoidia bacterium]